MRVKQLWVNFSFLKEIRLVWDRITVSRLTIGYILFSFFHCIIQIGFQSGVFIINAHAEDYLEGILAQAAAARPDTFPVLHQDIRLCTSEKLKSDSCFVAWDGSSQINFLSSNPPDRSQLTPATALPSATAADTATNTNNIPVPTPSTRPNRIFDPDNDGDDDSSELPTFAPELETLDDLFELPTTSPSTLTFPEEGVDADDEGSGSDDDESDFSLSKKSTITSRAAPFLNGYYTISLPEGEAQLTKACVDSLNYPVFALERTKREDAAFILFNIWVLGMSIVAVMNESIPHIVASLVTHFLATGWGATQLSHTHHFFVDFQYAITDGACAGAPSLLSNYWSSRSNAEIPALVLNAVALIISIVLSYFLAKTFGWKTFQRVGASLTINRLYKLVLVLSVAMQLALFFIALTVGLWVDQLIGGVAFHFAAQRSLYIAIGIVTIVLIGPWAFTGWTGARLEKRMRMGIFLGLSVLYILTWTVQFVSSAFRWVVWSWPFFQIMVIISLLLTAITSVLGLVVRINFGKGLVHYLNHHSELPEPDFEPYSGKQDLEQGGNEEEKIGFPGLQSDLQQYPDEPLPLAGPQLPPPPMGKKIKRKPVPSLPQSLKNIPRYQNVFNLKPAGIRNAVTSKFSFSTKRDSASSNLTTATTTTTQDNSDLNPISSKFSVSARSDVDSSRSSFLTTTTEHNSDFLKPLTSKFSVSGRSDLESSRSSFLTTTTEGNSNTKPLTSKFSVSARSDSDSSSIMTRSTERNLEPSSTDIMESYPIPLYLRT